MRVADKELLISRREIDENGCWNWVGPRTRTGYGYVFTELRTHLVHRVAWKLWVGPIPDGLCILHRCDNPSCFNLDHLFLGTNAENSRDMVMKGRARNGGTEHNRGALNPRARLTEDQVVSIRNDVRPAREIATEYGIAVSYVGKIRSRECWKHI